MKRNILFFTNIKKSQIKKVNGNYVISDIPITVDDEVMNKVHYDKSENAKGMKSMIGKPVTLSHPHVNGENVSAMEGNGLRDYYSGGTITSTSNSDGVWYASAEIKEKIMRAQDDGDRYANALDNMDNVGVSTGLTFERNEISGVNAKGKAYTRRAVNQNYNHLAMLLDERPAGGGATVMRFNSEDTDIVDLDEIIANRSSEQSDPDGALISKIWNKLVNAVKSTPDGQLSPDTKLTTKVSNHMSKFLEALNKANIDTKDMTDDQVFEAYNAMKDEEAKAKKDEDETKKKDEPKTNASDEKLNALISEVNSLKSQIADSADEKRSDAIKTIMARNSSFAEDELKEFPESAINKLLAEAQPAAGLLGGRMQANASKDELDDYIPE